jgi:hypothetical protein
MEDQTAAIHSLHKYAGPDITFFVQNQFEETRVVVIQCKDQVSPNFVAAFRTVQPENFYKHASALKQQLCERLPKETVIWRGLFSTRRWGKKIIKTVSESIKMEIFYFCFNPPLTLSIKRCFGFKYLIGTHKKFGRVPKFFCSGTQQKPNQSPK